jgi:hypothetical protein
VIGYISHHQQFAGNRAKWRREYEMTDRAADPPHKLEVDPQTEAVPRGKPRARSLWNFYELLSCNLWRE